MCSATPDALGVDWLVSDATAKSADKPRCTECQSELAETATLPLFPDETDVSGKAANIAMLSPTDFVGRCVRQRACARFKSQGIRTDVVALRCRSIPDHILRGAVRARDSVGSLRNIWQEFFFVFSRGGRARRERPRNPRHPETSHPAQRLSVAGGDNCSSWRLRIQAAWQPGGNIPFCRIRIVESARLQGADPSHPRPRRLLYRHCGCWHHRDH